jgi:hypothetical protein
MPIWPPPPWRDTGPIGGIIAITGTTAIIGTTGGTITTIGITTTTTTIGTTTTITTGAITTTVITAECFRLPLRKRQACRPRCRPGQ